MTDRTAGRFDDRTLDTLARMRRQQRRERASFLLKAVGGPVAVLVTVWWVTR